MPNISYEQLWSELDGTQAFAGYATRNYSGVTADRRERRDAIATLSEEVRAQNPQTQEEALQLAYRIMADVRDLDALNRYHSNGPHMHLALPDEQITADALSAIYMLIQYFKDHPYPADDEAAILKIIDTLTELVRYAQGLRAKLRALVEY